MDPGTAMLIATAVAASAKAGSDYFSAKGNQAASKRRARETKRETLADLFNEAAQENAEMEAHRLKSRNRLGRRKVQSLQDTSDLVRGAFNI